MKFILPLPPGINQTYGVKVEKAQKNEFALYKKRKVRDWEKEAGWEIKRQTRPKDRKFSLKHFRVDLMVYYSREIDIDAPVKVTLDLFEKMGIYKNDRQVKKLSIIKAQDIKYPRLEVDLSPYALD